jgi:DNA-binding Lrp family transcriptional regulator
MTGTAHLTQVRARANCRRQDGVRHSAHETSTRKPGRRLARARQDIPEVVQVYRMGCETDYLLRIVVSDIDDYDRV